MACCELFRQRAWGISRSPWRNYGESGCRAFSREVWGAAFEARDAKSNAEESGGGSSPLKGEGGRDISRSSFGAILTVRHPERGGPGYEVTYEAAGQSGWIHGSLIRFRTGATPLPTPTPKPTPSPSPSASPTPPSGDGEAGDEADSIKVWVNTNSGVYHCPGTRWYGNTKEGE